MTVQIQNINSSNEVSLHIFPPHSYFYFSKCSSKSKKVSLDVHILLYLLNLNDFKAIIGTYKKPAFSTLWLFCYMYVFLLQFRLAFVICKLRLYFFFPFQCPQTLLAFAQEHRTLQALKDNLTILPNLGGSIRLSRETFLSSCIQLTSFFILCCPVYIAKREDSLIGSVSRCMLASVMLEFLFYLGDKTLEMNNFRKDYRSLNVVFKLSRIF